MIKRKLLRARFCKTRFFLFILGRVYAKRFGGKPYISVNILAFRYFFGGRFHANSICREAKVILFKKEEISLQSTKRSELLQLRDSLIFSEKTCNKHLKRVYSMEKIVFGTTLHEIIEYG